MGSSKQKPASQPQKIDNKGASVLVLPRCVIDSPQWKALDYRARVVVLAMATFFNGFNNSHIGVSSRELADAIGSHNYTANERALEEAILAGFIVRERTFPKASRRSTEYSLTWIETGKELNRKKATHAYAAGEVIVRRKRSQPRKSVATIATSALRSSQQVSERRIATIATGEPENGHSRAAITATPLFMPSPSQSAEPSEVIGNARGPFRKPQSMTEDSWILAQRRAAKNPAGADENHVREQAQQMLSQAPRGAQRRLAEATGIPCSTLNKFLKGAPLPSARLADLMVAVLREAA